METNNKIRARKMYKDFFGKSDKFVVISTTTVLKFCALVNCYLELSHFGTFNKIIPNWQSLHSINDIISLFSNILFLDQKNSSLKIEAFNLQKYNTLESHCKYVYLLSHCIMNFVWTKKISLCLNQARVENSAMKSN